MKFSKKGETLIEILVSVAILALISAPLLHPFVTASKSNTAAKRIQLATEVAENVMEKLKGEKISNVARDFNHSDVDRNGLPINTNVAEGRYISTEHDYQYGEFSYDAGNGRYISVDNATSSVKILENAAGNPASRFIGQPDNEYYFLMPQKMHGKFNSDVVVHYKASSINDIYGSINNIYSMNRSDCAYYAETEGMEKAAADKFRDSNTKYNGRSKSVDVNTVYKEMRKEIKIKIDYDTNGKYTTVSVEYKFVANEGITPPEENTYIDTQVIFDNYSTGTALSAVYLYFFPFYASGIEGYDSFTIENNIPILDDGSYKVDVFLIKMDCARTTVFNEANYRAKINVHETATADSAEIHTKIHSNNSNDKWNRSSSNPKVGGNYEINDLGNNKDQIVSFDVEILVYKHNDDSFSYENGADIFTPDSKDYVCKISGSILDNSLKE